MLKLLVVLPAALLFAFLSQETPAPPAPEAPPAPAAAAPMTATNPVTPTAESRAHAKTTYAIDCAMCHGENGNGKGDLVGDMKLTMNDLTNPDSLKNMSDGELFNLIKDGKGKMPAEGPRAKDDVLWNLVIYVRSLSKQ